MFKKLVIIFSLSTLKYTKRRAKLFFELKIAVSQCVMRGFYLAGIIGYLSARCNNRNICGAISLCRDILAE